jgi:hypothetical protein
MADVVLVEEWAEEDCMQTNIDFTRGGYHGDPVENHFKDFTRGHMPFWWHFREVLRPTSERSPYLERIDGTTPSDDEQRDFVALSLLNYAVYTGMAEAFDFFEQMQYELWGLQKAPTSGSLVVPSPTGVTGSYSGTVGDEVVVQSSKEWQAFEVTKYWRAAYSGLYRTFNALCNVVSVVVGKKTPLRRNKAGDVWTYGYNETLGLVAGGGAKGLVKPLDRCSQRLEIRHHLDHCWLIWHSVGPGRFLLDANSRKGYLPIDPGIEVSVTLDAHKRTQQDIEGSAKDFNLVYREIAVKGGFLDQYLVHRDWRIDYSDYGPPHNGKRPLP